MYIDILPRKNKLKEKNVLLLLILVGKFKGNKSDFWLIGLQSQ